MLNVHSLNVNRSIPMLNVLTLNALSPFPEIAPDCDSLRDDVPDNRNKIASSQE